MPVMDATHGAYTLDQLEDMPLWRLLELWEAVIYRSTAQWNAGEPKRYVPQEPKD